jgi:hypothetical protein
LQDYILPDVERTYRVDREGNLPIHLFHWNRGGEPMDLRSYYRKVREADATLSGEDIVMVSLETTEGGKAGVRTEVPRAIAARLIAELRARPATGDEACEFHDAHRAAREAYAQDEAAKRVQVMVIPAHELKKQRDRS